MKHTFFNFSKKMFEILGILFVPVKFLRENCPFITSMYHCVCFSSDSSEDHGGKVCEGRLLQCVHFFALQRKINIGHMMAEGATLHKDVGLLNSA